MGPESELFRRVAVSGADWRWLRSPPLAECLRGLGLYVVRRCADSAQTTNLLRLRLSGPVLRPLVVSARMAVEALIRLKGQPARTRSPSGPHIPTS
jgi:hypothetical protein